MPGYVRHSKDDFLRLFESGALQDEVIAYVTNLRDDPDKGEKRSWNNSYALMDIVLRDGRIPADMEVVCECPLAYGRADMVLLSPSDPKGRIAIVAELKQWDKFFPADLEKMRRAGKPVHDLRDPLAQAAAYAQRFEAIKAEFGASTVMACVYLHNIKESDYRAIYPKPTERHDEVRAFYQGDTENFREFIREAFEGDALAPTYAIKRAQEAGYWADPLPQAPSVLREKLIELGLAQAIEGERSQYEPTPLGAALGIRRFNGYDALKEKPFVNCAFTDSCMRHVAEELLKAQS